MVSYFKNVFKYYYKSFFIDYFFSFLFICVYECIVTHSVLSVSLSQHSYHKACLAKDFVRWEYLQWSKGPLLHLAGLAPGPSHAKWCSVHQHLPFSPKVAAITETILYFGNEITTWYVDFPFFDFQRNPLWIILRGKCLLQQLVAPSWFCSDEESPGTRLKIWKNQEYSFFSHFSGCNMAWLVMHLPCGGSTEICLVSWKFPSFLPRVV